MILINPQFLWLLLPFIALCWWRLRRTGELGRNVSTLAIWQQLLAEQGQGQTTALRIPWRLLLELLAGLLIILTIVNPAYVEEDPLLVLVDQSGSMGAPNRVAGAKLRVSELKKENRGSVDVVFLPPDKNGFPPHWTQLLSSADYRGRRTEIVSDFLAANVSLPPNVGFQVISDPVHNVGLVKARAVPATEGGISLFVAIARTTNEIGGKVEVQILVPGLPTPIHALTFEGGVSQYQQETVALSIPQDAQSLIIRLPQQDDLSFDNQMTLSRPHPARLVFSEPGRGSETWQAMWDAAAALRFDPIMAVNSTTTRSQFVLSVGMPTPSARGNLVMAATSLPKQVLMSPEATTRRSAKLNDLPGINDWLFQQRFQTPLPQGFQLLVSTQSGPVVVKEKATNTIFVAGDPIKSKWAERAFFPLMIRALLTELGFEGSGSTNAWQPHDPTSQPLESRLNETQASTSPQQACPATNPSSRAQPWGPWLGLITCLLLLALALDCLKQYR